MNIESLRKGWVYSEMENLTKLEYRSSFFPFYYKQKGYGYSLRIVR